ncbi:hypothetical protein BJY04DRAFT_127709 [Aspergillus karnatakaensis]|uniref:uncharacterized protein n=1 Tax=Aspergillus karnatakaensis TaxID=1810916 RepID=UPI003CCCC33E
MENLPRGLVSTSVQIPTELVRFDAVDVGDIVQLWKAYSTNPAAHEGVAGFRLQNFFWRIWSSERLSTSISGSTLARLFLQISEPNRTLLKPTKASEPPSSSLKPEKHQPGPAPGTGPSSSSGNTTKQPLPPILKKSNSSSHGGETQKTTRLLLTGLGGESVTRKPSNPPTPIPPSRPVVFAEQSTRPSQKKAFAVASKAKGPKRRPVLMRRKSSQQSSVASTRAPSPESSPALKPLNIQALQEIDVDEEALEDTAEPPTSPTNSIPTTAVPPPPNPPNPPPDPNEDPNDFHLIEDFDPNPRLPETFIHELKHIMHKNTPLPPLKPWNPTPAVGFFSSTACRNYDVRHLSAENYVQPSKYKLVGEGFRGRFAEQMRFAEEEYREWVRVQMEIQMASEMEMQQNMEGGGASSSAPPAATTHTHHQHQHSTQNPETDTESGEYTNIDSPAMTATTTAGTVSPSRLGDLNPQSQPQSPGKTSTIATSILIPGSNDGTEVFSLVDLDPDASASASGIAGSMAIPVPVPVPVPGPAGSTFRQTPAGLSVPRGPSGLSLLVEQARSLADEEDWSDDDVDEGEIEDEVR